MGSPTLASFQATDGTGRWELTSAGVRVNGELWRFTDHSSIVCVTDPGHVMRGSRVVEEEDGGFGDIAALAVLQSGGGQSSATGNTTKMPCPATAEDAHAAGEGGITFVNPGSIGYPKDGSASYALYENGAVTIRLLYEPPS